MNWKWHARFVRGRRLGKHRLRNSGLILMFFKLFVICVPSFCARETKTSSLYNWTVLKSYSRSSHWLWLGPTAIKHIWRNSLLFQLGTLTSARKQINIWLIQRCIPTTDPEVAHSPTSTCQNQPGRQTDKQNTPTDTVKICSNLVEVINHNFSKTCQSWKLLSVSVTNSCEQDPWKTFLKH